MRLIKRADGKADREIGISSVPHRKNPVLYIGIGNLSTVVASFKSEESAKVFDDFLRDMFSLQKKEVV